jgi:exodeoxyribonuclease VII large subunit
VRAPDATTPYPTVPVGRLANYISRRLGEDPKLRWIGVRGEVTNWRSPQANGNVYFDIKDRDAVLNCVVWSEAASTLPPLKNGDEIIAVGSIGTFARKSTYQLVVTIVEQSGIGRLHALYEQLRRRLEDEGLFASARKRALPKFPFRVGLISARGANGAGDFLVQARANAPHVEIVLFETPVQGMAAAPEIVRAIERASRADLDLVVLARGGGSFEDLFVFSDERVVRAFARCAHPTVAAIGHEADAPLVDFVADHRAPTPSAAAQTVLPRRAELLRRLGADANSLERTLGRTFTRLRRELDRIEIRSPLADARRLLGPRRQRLDTTSAELGYAVTGALRTAGDRTMALARALEAASPYARLVARRDRFIVARYRLDRAAEAPFARERSRLNTLRTMLPLVAQRGLERRRVDLRLAEAHIRGKDPEAILQRGYAILRLEDEVVVRDAAQAPPGTTVSAQLAHGKLYARVEITERDD